MGIQAIQIQGGLGIGVLGDAAPEAASQTFEPGAVLISSSGLLAEASNDPAVATVVGFATGPATGVTGTDVPFTPARRGLYLIANLDNAQSGGNAPGTKALAATDRFAKYGLGKDGASGNWYIDAASSVDAVQIIRLLDPIGTTQGRVLAVMLS